MKSKLSLFVVALISVFLFSCGNNTETKDKTTDSKENVTNVNEKEKSEEKIESTDEEQILVLSELKNGEVYNDLSVSDYYYVVNEEFGFTLKGEFEITGNIMIDEMWGELSVSFDEDSNPHKNLIVDNDGFKKTLIQFAYFNNPNDVRAKLSDENLKMVENGESITVTMKVKDFSVGGKLDGYSESYIEFLDIIE